MSNTASQFPTNTDQHLHIPASPKVARLSEAEAPDDYGQPYALNENSHSDLHHAENNSIKAIETAVICDDSTNVLHDHSDPWNVDYSADEYRLHPANKHGRHLFVQNSHTFNDKSSATDAMSSAPDTDFAGIHHSLGKDGTIGDYQAVSGKMWKDKGLPDVPDGFFDDLNQLINKWLTSITPYPGDNLSDILMALLEALKNQNDELAKQNKTLRAIIDKVYRGGKINEDGSITWGIPTGKIPVADLNIFSNSNPNNSTVNDAIRSRDFTNDDVRVK